MDVHAKMIADSVSMKGVRLTTMELTYWLMVHNEDLRHRTMWRTDSMKFDQWLDAGRSVASNRALAPADIRRQVVDDPYIPKFVSATRGMVGGDRLTEIDQQYAEGVWLAARDAAVLSFDAFDKLPAKIHKQHRNRLLAPWQMITVVTTANDQWWKHYFELRNHPNAQPDFQVVAELAQQFYNRSEPHLLVPGEWHLPYITWEDWAFGFDDPGDPFETAKKVSVARCARTSYLRQGLMLPTRDDLRLYGDLDSSVPAHDSPKEHVCTPLDDPDERAGCYVGWRSFRHSA